MALPDLAFVVLGLALGGVFALSGVGLVVLYRATGVVNLAYGAIGATGALIAWSLINDRGVNEWLAYAVCVLFGGVVTVLYGAFFGPAFAKRGPLVKATATIGLLLLLLGIMSYVWGDDAHSLTLPTTEWSFQLGDVFINATQLIALGLGIAVTAGTALFLKVTNVGTAMRALANDHEITAMLGVPVRRVEALAWFGSGVLAGLTGLLLSNLVGLDAVGLTFLVISALAAALAGRLWSLWGTLAAGLAIGVIQSSLAYYSGIGSYRAMTPFVFAILVLLWFARKPTPVKLSSMGTTAAPQAERPAPSGGRRWALEARALDHKSIIQLAVIAGLLVIVLVAIPSLVSTYWVQVSTTVAIYSVVAMGLGLLVGRVALVSLGQVALLALGAWIGLRLSYATSMPFPFLVLVTGLITAAIGILVGLPALRLSGLHLALITLMMAGAIGIVLQTTNFPNGGGGFLGYDTQLSTTSAVPRPSIALTDTAYFRYVVVVSVLMFGLALLYLRGKTGRAWAAIRQSDPAALAAGVNITKYKLWAFALASFVTGVAGCLLAGSSGGVTALQFPTQDSITLLSAVLIGGAYSLWGAAVAGVATKLFPALFDDLGVSPDLLLIIFGIGTLQVLLTAPRGLAYHFPRDMAKLGRLIWRLVSSGRRGRGSPPAPAPGGGSA